MQKSHREGERPHEPEERRPTILLMLRHTEVHNPEDILYGRLPRFHLSDKGFRQAEVVATALQDANIGVFYTSPRLRARQTARVISSRHPGVPLHATKLLDEVLTAWQGRPHSHLGTHRFDFYGHPLADTDETLEGVAARVSRFVTNVRERHFGEITVAVTHGDLAMIARAMYLKMPLELDSLRLPNIYAGHGSITRLTFGPSLEDTYPFSVDYWDPNSHGYPWSPGYMELQPGVGLKEGADLQAAG